MASGSKKVIYAALIGNALIAITKFIASTLTGSSAMLSEGVHSLVDTGNQLLLLHGLRRSRQPADEEFPFGHGKEVYFWSFVVAILVFAVGAGVSIFEGIEHVLHPKPIESPMINYLVLGLAMLFEGTAWGFAFREFNAMRGKQSVFHAVRHGKDPTLFVVLFEDSAAMLGLFVAFVSVMLVQFTGNPIYDGVASIIIGLILGATAVWLAYESKSLVTGESASPEVVEGIRRIAQAEPGVEHLNEVLTMHMGPEYVLVNLSVDFSDSKTTSGVESTIDRLDRVIKREFPNVKRLFVEAESRDASPTDRSSADME